MSCGDVDAAIVALDCEMTRGSKMSSITPSRHAAKFSSEMSL